MSWKKGAVIWRRSFSSGCKLSQNFEWIKPDGYKTDISVYNPITKNKTDLILRNNKIATWYMCGPTVYASAHIGHACTYVRFDIIRRILTEFFDINVLLVMGMTDIDDKIIQRSNLYKENWLSLTNHYETEFLIDMDSLNVLRPLIICKVSNYIPQIINFIKSIMDKDGAYVTNDGSVYFDTSKHSFYGKLKNPEQNESHANKKSSLDFALWKASKENEPWWESPWGRGRPGWHIECSAIASTIFGKNIDIHSGGIDLLFPHHENEEAQSCCHHDVDQWVNYWMHTGHLHLYDNQKMSKSLNNAIHISSMLEHYSTNEFRLLCLLKHYRSNVEFDEDSMKQASMLLKKIRYFVNDCREYIAGKEISGNIDEVALLSCLEKTKIEVKNALADDFNTPKATHLILNLVSLGTKMMHTSTNFKIPKTKLLEPRQSTCLAATLNYIEKTISSFGIKPETNQLQSERLTKILDTFVEFRNGVRVKVLKEKEKDMELLKACDKTRGLLSEYGMDINDQQGKSTWSLKN